MDDFGVIGMEVEGNMVLGQHQQGGSFDPNSKRKFSGGSGSSVEDDQSRALKPARNGLDLGLPKQMSLLRSASSCDGGLGGPQQQPQMVSFSSPTSQVSFLSACKNGGGVGGGGMPLSYYQNSPAPAPVYPRNAGYASESFTGIRGPFTPAQWIELEHQALIYKYLTANVPVPATLLIPIRKALISSGYSGFSTGSFPAHSYGWGPFHRGYTRGSIDPEPGRCRRTDGKKWRCSRDAVPEQKYCERHINRGRHRSRKPVESQTGQASSGPTNLKVVPTSSTTTTTKSSSATSGGGSSSNNLAIAAHQLKCLQASSCSLSTDSVVNRMQGSQGFSMMPTSKDSPFTATKQHVPYEESPHSGFGFVSSESLLNPSPSYLNSKTYNSLLGYNDQQRQEQHQIRHESNRSTITWPDELTSNWTQLSMSMPMSELSSSSSNQEKGVASPLRLSHELDQTQMEEFSNWEPISWGDSMGDPLREVLNNASGSRHFSDSPTGVLQTGASASNSNSPRDEDKATHDDLLASCNS